MNTPFYTLLAILALLLSVSCNPVKNVLNSPSKTQKVVDKYLQDYPITPGQSITTFIPGDTVTQVVIGYDTATSITHDTVKVTKTIIKTNSIHDTVRIQLPPDNGVIEGFKKLLNDKNGSAEVLAEKYKTEQGNVDYWRIRFWIVIALMGLSIAAKFYFKI